MSLRLNSPLLLLTEIQTLFYTLINYQVGFINTSVQMTSIVCRERRPGPKTSLVGQLRLCQVSVPSLRVERAALLLRLSPHSAARSPFHSV